MLRSDWMVAQYVGIQQPVVPTVAAGLEERTAPHSPWPPLACSGFRRGPVGDSCVAVGARGSGLAAPWRRTGRSNRGYPQADDPGAARHRPIPVERIE